MAEKKFSKEEAAKILDSLGLSDKYDANEFYMGINVELEHGTVDPATNVTDDGPVVTAKITGPSQRASQLLRSIERWRKKEQ